MSEPTIAFPDATIAYCPRHLRPLQARWPAGYTSLCLEVLDRMLEEPEFKARLDKDAEGLYVLDEVRAGKILAELSPLCCLLHKHGHWQALIDHAVANAIWIADRAKGGAH